jgi:hypothetical protein
MTGYVTNYMAQWSRVMEKPTVLQLGKKFHVLVRPQGSPPWSEQSATVLMLSQMNPVHILPTYVRFFLILFCTCTQDYPTVSFL